MTTSRTAATDEVAGGTSSPATLLAKALRHQGSDIAFGVPGGGPNLEVVGALDVAGIRFVLAHGESSACIMASTYGHLTGRPAAAVVTRGPGATSAANGAAQATLDRHPLILVTDTVPQESRSRIPHQRVDQQAMFAPLTKRSATLHSGMTIDSLTALISQAGLSPAGTVHLDYDASATIDGFVSHSNSPVVRGVNPPGLEQATKRATKQATKRASERATEMVQSASRPVVILGLGAARPWNGQALLEALERFGAPVLTTYQGVGSIPSEHPLAAGLFTNGASEAGLLKSADLIIAIGLDMVEPIPGSWDYDAPVLSLTSSETVDPYLPLAQELVGEPAALAATTLRRSHEWPEVAGSDYRAQVRSQLKRSPLGSGAPDAASAGLDPISLVETVANAAPHNVTATVDAGAHFLAVMPFWPAMEPGRLLISNGLATMGYAVPAAVGAALARPERPVVCFVGDGGLGMTAAELETVARLSLPVTVIVFNDSALSLIRIKQHDGQGGADAVSYRPTDFANIATAMGVPGTKVTDLDHLGTLLADGWDRPRLLDVTVDPSSYPHLIAVTRG